LVGTEVVRTVGVRFATLVSQTAPQAAILLMAGFSFELLEADRRSPSTWELLRKPCSREEPAGAIANIVGGD
jgi:hypothetical protein